MLFVRQVPVDSQNKVIRVVIIRKRSTVHIYIRLSMCIPFV